MYICMLSTFSESNIVSEKRRTICDQSAATEYMSRERFCSITCSSK